MHQHFTQASRDAIKALKGDGESCEGAKQIFHLRDDLCFVWSHRDGQILAVQTLAKDEQVVTRLVPTDTPLFDVENVAESPTGRWLCLWGSRGLTAVEMPRRSSSNRGKFVGTDGGQVMCKAVPIAERYFMCNAKVVLQQACWHPGSAYDSHLMVLTSDNHIRIFDLDGNDETGLGVNVSPEQTLPLSNIDGKKSFFGDSSVSVKASLGETAVSFAFAPPVGSSDSPANPNVWPVFVLFGNGSVYCTLTGLGKFKPNKHRVMGPLPMLPESEDNYGNDSCAILCLNPVVSSPPVLVIGTSNGSLYHCVVLHKFDDDDGDDDRLETLSQASEWSTSLFDDGTSAHTNLSLHVYESVELELALTNSSEDATAPFDYPIRLHVDPASPSRYFCSHKAGVHCVNLPMVGQLTDLARKPDETIDGRLDLADNTSSVVHLVCTQVSGSTSPAPVLGLALSFPPARLSCLLSDYSVVTLALSAPQSGQPLPLLSSAADAKVGGNESPLKKAQMGKEPFDKHIAKMLQRNTSHPLMKASGDASLSSQECYDILMRSTRVLRDEYLSKFERARNEIERKAASLEARKSQQHLSLAKLSRERFGLRDTAADLSERYEDIRDAGEAITRRLEAVLSAIQHRLPVSSDAEMRMQRQFHEIERRMKDLKNGLEQIRAKEKYQLRQIKQKQLGNVGVASNQLAPNQAESMKEVLKDDGKVIADMVKRLNSMKKDLSV